MHRLTVSYLVLFLFLNAYSQNFYQITKKGAKEIQVRRTTTVLPQHMSLASRVIASRAVSTLIDIDPTRVTINANIKQPVCAPTELVGGYNYLRTVSRRLKSLPKWKKTAKTNGYNGAHHIVTQTVIGEIARELGLKHIPEIKSNAPAVYSPLHGEPAYNDLFHNHPRLLEIYYSKGVRGVVLDFFERLNEAHKKEGLPTYSEDAIDLQLKEAELWSKHWGLKWK